MHHIFFPGLYNCTKECNISLMQNSPGIMTPKGPNLPSGGSGIIYHYFFPYNS